MIFLQNISDFFINIKLENMIDILIAFVIVFLFKIFSPLIAYILIKMFHFREKNNDKIKSHAFYKPLKALFLILGVYIATLLFAIPPIIRLGLVKVFRICIIIIISNGFANLLDINSNSFKTIRKKLHFKGNDTLINFISKFLKILIYIVAGFIAISELGYNLGGLITGLGISSVVVALAAQDLAKSLLGGICILLDKPFNIGDYIIVNNFEGTVEDITFRTTRIRNIANEMIIVPNSIIVENYITNYSKRIKRLYTLNLTFELATPLDKITTFKTKLLMLLLSKPHVLDENIRIFFDNISDNGIDISINLYTDILEYNDFLQFKENMNFEILNLIQKENIELAYNSQTIYLKK